MGEACAIGAAATIETGPGALGGCVAAEAAFWTAVAVLAAAKVVNDVVANSQTGDESKAKTVVEAGTSAASGSPDPDDQGEENERELSQGEARAIKKIDNITGNFKESDIDGMIRDLKGDPVVKDGKVWNHLKEMKDVVKGLQNHIGTLDGVESAPAKAARQKAVQLLDKIRSAVEDEGFDIDDVF